MHEEPEETEELRSRVHQLEALVDDIKQSIEAFAEEVRTRQLVIVDEEDRPRIIGEVFADVAELRLELPTSSGHVGPELLLFALTRAGPGAIGLGPALGMQLRAAGKAIFELDAWPDSDEVWSPHMHIGGR